MDLSKHIGSASIIVIFFLMVEHNVFKSLDVKGTPFLRQTSTVFECTCCDIGQLELC